MMDVTGFAETGPTKVGVAITDCLAALYAVQGILLAHISRSSTGQGQFVDIALLDSAVSVLGLHAGIVAATGRGPGRLGNEHPSLAPYEPYPAERRRRRLLPWPTHVCGRAFAPRSGRGGARARSSICHQQRAPDEPIAA